MAAAGGDDSEQNKSEQPTSFKLAKSREKGSVARGSDLGFLTGLCAFIGFAWIAGASFSHAVAGAAKNALVGAPSLADGSSALYVATSVLFAPVLPYLALMAVVIFAIVLLFEVIQTGPVFSAEPLRPDFSRLNPAKGLKRVFSVRLLIETGKNILKMCTYTTAGYLVVRGTLQTAPGTIQDGRVLLSLLSSTGLKLLTTLALIAIVFATIDQLIARRDFLKRMRMSRREIRRETREREGEPRLKQKRKQLHAEYAKLSQSVRNIKGADVLITNPNHIAVALRYERKTMQAPVIVSVATNQSAQRLKRLAFIYNIPVVQNVPLARALFARARLGAQIPDQCFRAVADIYNAIRQQRGATDATAHA